MSDLDSFSHKKFKYIYIPQDPEEEVMELEFEGLEGKFRKTLRNHFHKETLTDSNGLASSIQQQHSAASPAQIKSAVQSAQNASYQIVPLTLPKKDTGYIGINAYVDDIGQFKNYKVNSRATRVLSSECKGDCFISKTFDDEDLFERRDFTMDEYKEFLANPPNPKGRWDPSMAFTSPSAAMNQQINTFKNIVDNSEDISIAKEKLGNLNKCGSCHVTPENDKKLMRCGRCQQIAYCGVDCQKKDWKSHKRVCVSKNA
eukprot:GDKJ01018578.1.p1 GENE.GDKJ01018578.1~~GDKJ01018578.1.p1  ORF type:complete len:258 (+),score=56.70 GDKJ01018578.1:1-774(+)